MADNFEPAAFKRQPMSHRCSCKGYRVVIAANAVMWQI